MEGLAQSLIAQIPVWSDGAAFPERVWILKGQQGSQTCFAIPKWDVAGLAVFSSEHAAYRFGEWLPEESGMSAEEVPVLEAWEIALRLGKPVKSLLLLDQIDRPMVFPI